MHWGEVAEYIESYVAVVDGHLVVEITAMEGKFFISFMQMVKGNKYIDAFRQTLDELGLEYRMTGPFPKHLSKREKRCTLKSAPFSGDCGQPAKGPSWMSLPVCAA